MSKLVLIFDGEQSHYFISSDESIVKGDYVFFARNKKVSAGVVENIVSWDFLSTERAKDITLPLQLCEKAVGLSKELCIAMVDENLSTTISRTTHNCVFTPDPASIESAHRVSKDARAKKDSQSYKMFGKKVKDFTKQEMYQYKRHMRFRLMAGQKSYKKK